MTRPEKLVIQLSVVTMVFGHVSSVFRYMYWVPKWYHIWDNKTVLKCTIVFATINNIKGNWQCIGTYISYFKLNNLIAACVDGTYGQNCSKDCSNNCYNNTCHVVSDLCLSGCRKGLMGPYCKQRKSTNAKI